MNIHNIKNFKKLNSETKTLFCLILTSNNLGEINVRKPQLAEYLGISRQTVGKHLKTFSECNMIKFKHSGKMRLNPDFYFKGQPYELEKAQRLYAEFKSDV